MSNELTIAVGFDDRRRARVLAAAMDYFDKTADKAAAAETIRRHLEPHGVKGLSLPSLYRKWAAWRASNHELAAVVDHRSVRLASAAAPVGIEANTELVNHWHDLCCKNRRKSAPAFRALVRELTGGMAIPGVGTWADIWSRENGGAAVPEGMRCPYDCATLPHGWRRLMKLKPDQYGLTATRTGTMAAALAYAPTVVRTRVGLAPCQVVQVDDAWHEVKVVWEENKKAQRVVELSMVDVLTGHVISYLVKPVRERDDGTRETLRQEWMRYFVAHLLCDVGIPSAGCTIQGEHGTATMDADLLAAIREVAGESVRFQAGGLLSKPLAMGLPGGVAKGNPRFKGLIEGLHGLVKNELGDITGNVGGGRAAQPEDAGSLERMDRDLRSIAATLEDEKPGILERLRLPFLLYWDYAALVDFAYDRIDTRTDHALEGWERCGFMVGEWRPAENQGWQSMSILNAMKPEAAAAFRSLILSDAKLYRTRRMSPREAWAMRAEELNRLEPSAAIILMGQNLARACRCSERLELDYRDETTLRRCKVVGQLDGGALLKRGETYNVWINPLRPGTAYVADAVGRYLGTAAVQVAARYDDIPAIQKQLGARASAIAAEQRRLAPVVYARLARAAEDARSNAAELLGTDPTQDAQSTDAALAGIAKIKDDDLLPSSAKQTGINLDDLI